MARVDGIVALLADSASGIGLATEQLMTKEGAEVVIGGGFPAQYIRESREGERKEEFCA